MKICVIDCSFLMSFFLPDEEKSKINLVDYEVYIPSIFFLECLNVLNVAFKKKRMTQTKYDESIWFLKNLPFFVDHFSSTQESLQTIYRLSEDHNLTSYDASYVVLAWRLKVPIGTLDKKIIEACSAKKIPVL